MYGVGKAPLRYYFQVAPLPRLLYAVECFNTLSSSLLPLRKCLCYADLFIFNLRFT